MGTKLPENWNDLLKPIETEESVNILKVLREKGPLTSEELAESVSLTPSQVLHNINRMSSAPNLGLDGDWTEQETGVIGKVYSVNPDVADSYLEAVECLRKLFGETLEYSK